jgi:hypothetical protein
VQEKASIALQSRTLVRKTRRGKKRSKIWNMSTHNFLNTFSIVFALTGFYATVGWYVNTCKHIYIYISNTNTHTCI